MRAAAVRAVEQSDVVRRARAWAWPLAALAAIALPLAAAAEGPPLRFLGNRNIPPVVYVDGDVPTGVAVDLVRALAPHLPRPMELRAVDWSEAQAMVLRGEADALIQMNPSEERRALYDFSEPLLESRFSIFVRTGSTDISGPAGLRHRRVGVEAGGLPQQVLARDSAVGLVVIPDFLTAFRMLAAREIDAVVVDLRVGSFVIARHGLRGLTVVGDPVATSWSAIAVRKGDAALLRSLDDALRAIRADGTYARVLTRWEPKEVVFWTREQVTHGLALATILVLVVLLLLSGAWFQALRRALSRRRAAEEGLKQRDALLDDVILGNDASFFSLDREYRYTSFNAHHARVMRELYGTEIRIGRSLLECQVNPADREIARRNLDRALAGEHVVAEAYSGEAHRARRYLRVSHSPVRDDRGAVIGIAVLSQDLTEHRQTEETIGRMNRELRALTTVNKTVMRASDEESLLRDVCRIICDEGGYRMAWVAYPARDEAKSVTPVAWAGVDEASLTAANITWADEPRGRGPVGTAIRTGKSTCIEDFAVDPEGAPWRETALARGFRSATALPLEDRSGLFGVLCIYSAEPGAFTADERRLLEEMAGDLSFGISVVRARAELDRAERDRSAHLFFLETMERVNRAIAGATDLEQMTGDVLGVALSAFGADRAFLTHPCDPGAPSWRVPIERCRPEYPGASATGAVMTMDPEIAAQLQALLDADGPVEFGPGAAHPLPHAVAARYGFRSLLSMAVRPKIGKPWQFGLHQCSHARAWTADEKRLLLEVGRRLGDALTTLLLVRDLRESEERLAKAERIVHVGYWDLDPISDTLSLSDETYRICGVDPGDAPVGLRRWRGVWESLIDPRDRERTTTALQEALSGGARFDVEYRLVRPDGEVRYVHGQADPSLDGSGRPVRLLGTLQDITDRKRAEEALRRSEEQYRRIVETAHEGIWVTDAEGRTTFVNRQMAQMLGCSVQELLGQPATAFVDEDELELKRRGQRRRSGIAEQHELRFRRKDGTTVWTLAESAPLLDEKGTYTGTLTMLTDVTERRAMESQLRQSQKLEAVGRLAGGVAHDFNNLLTAILGNATVLAEELDAAHPLRTEAVEIEATARRAALLTRQLLAFGRKQSLELRVIDLGEVLTAMDRMLRRLIGEDVELSTIVPAGLGSVRADPVQIEQVILNLAVNARDAMPRGGRLVIEAANVDVPGDEADPSPDAGRGRYVMLAVRDTGSGMSAEVQAHLFEPFFTTKERGKGTGLGLATVYGIVKQAGGDVRVRTDPGKGTAFEVYLPRLDGPADALAAPPQRELARGSELVLVVEDEPMVRALAVRVLRGAGYEVLDASDADHALRLAAEVAPRPIDLLLTDVVMPRIGGPELADRLRAARPELPVLFASGYMDRVSDVQAQLGRRTGFISKPFTPAELAHKVRELLDRGDEPSTAASPDRDGARRRDEAGPAANRGARDLTSPPGRGPP